MRIYVWAGVVGLMLVYGIYGIATVDRRTDEQRILSLIDSTARAVENHDLSGTISAVSRQYKDESGFSYDRLRVLAAQGMRSETSYKVRVEPGPVGVVADTATVQVCATVIREDGGIVYDRTIDLELKRENAWRALLIPTKTWRVTSSQNLGANALQNW